MSFYNFVPLGDTLKRKAIVSLYFFAFVLAPINCLWSKLTSDNDLSMTSILLFRIPACFEALFKVRKALIKRRF